MKAVILAAGIASRLRPLTDTTPKCLLKVGERCLGMEIQPKNMTDEEKELCRKAIADYKMIRPVVQLGDIYRLLSPYDRLGVTSLMYVSPEKEKAVFYWWKTEHFCNQHLPRIRMAGLHPDKIYKVTELNRMRKILSLKAA